jgi:hypothetical protein
MEPRREEPKVPKPRPEEKPRRFRLVKLEDRIAPGGGSTHKCRGGCSGGTGCDASTTLSIE